MTAERPKHVLILDDERAITDILCVILEQHGYAVRGVYTHREAIVAAREFRPDIFITGFKNGEKNGCETAAEIVDLLGQCHVLVLSGAVSYAEDASQEYRKHGYEFEVVSKPMQSQALLHWLAAEGKHDVRSCSWCQEQWAKSEGAYLHGEGNGRYYKSCPCHWCRALREISSGGVQRPESANE